MKRSRIGKIILTVLLICNIGALGCIAHMSYYQAGVIQMLQNKIDILAQYQEERVQYVEDMIYSVMSSIINLDRRDGEANKNVDKLKTQLEQLKNKVEGKKTIDLNNIKKIKEANVLIKNLTMSCQGSGTHVKIDGEDYVLTCGHLINPDIEDNTLVIVSDRGTWARATIVKYNQEKDLALLKCPQLKQTAYLEISTEAPKEGSEVTVVGNPSGLTDMITDGIVSLIDKKNESYLITNKIYFGNSGGALLYKGKIVGVMSQLCAFSKVYPTGIIAQNYGLAVSLKEIQNFLKEANYEQD